MEESAKPAIHIIRHWNHINIPLLHTNILSGVQLSWLVLYSLLVYLPTEDFIGMHLHLRKLPAVSDRTTTWNSLLSALVNGVERKNDNTHCRDGIGNLSDCQVNTPENSAI